MTAAATNTDLGLTELAGQAHTMGSALVSAVRAELLSLAKQEEHSRRRRSGERALL